MTHPTFNYAHLCQTQDKFGWFQVAIELSDGSTIFVDIAKGKLVSHYSIDKDGNIHHERA